MTVNIHPKTSAAGLGGSLGVLIVSVLATIHGVHLGAAAQAAIPTFLSTVFAYFAPAQQTVPIVVQTQPHPPAPAPPAAPVA